MVKRAGVAFSASHDVAESKAWSELGARAPRLPDL